METTTEFKVLSYLLKLNKTKSSNNVSRGYDGCMQVNDVCSVYISMLAIKKEKGAREKRVSRRE